MASELQAQLDRLLEKEKVARLNNEHVTSSTVLQDIVGEVTQVTLCFQAQAWDLLCQKIKFLMERRGQSKKAQIEMIQKVMAWVPGLQEPQRTQLLLTIRDVCAKKIYLEVEYARCVMHIVKGKEDANSIDEAASILQEVQVETYGSMDRREKLEFILYQMKIMLKKQDYVRLFVISKKINQSNLNEPTLSDLKAEFFSYLVAYHLKHQDFEALATDYLRLHEALVETSKAGAERLQPEHFALPGGRQIALSAAEAQANYIAFLVLQPFSAELQAKLQALASSDKIEARPELLHLLRSFLSEELISCDPAAYQLGKFEVFGEAYPHGAEHRERLQKMLVQHNLRLIAAYYSRIRLARVAELLGVEPETCEEELCLLNNVGILGCRMDRVEGTVDFQPVNSEETVLQHWATSVSSVLESVDIVAKLISREREIASK